MTAPISNDVICTRRGDYSTSTKVTEVHEHPSSNPLTIALGFKYGLILLAALTVPIIIFKMFILPMAILTSLKMISLVNSLLLGSLLLKYKWGHQHGQSHDHHGHVSHGNHGNVHQNVGHGTGGGSGSMAVPSTPSSLGNRIEIEYDT